jgi:glutamate-1-semialdehyde 2,1-aminomutase
VKIAGTTSTGSKRPDALFGRETEGVPREAARSEGARIWDPEGREYLDFVMGLGAVALGYRDPVVTRAAIAAAERGAVASLAPADERAVAEALGRCLPWAHAVRFLKTGAEGVAAAVRIARTVTGRDRIAGCGYHGWLDLASREPGVPAVTRALYRPIPFNEVEATRAAIREEGRSLAAVVVEPVIDGPPSPEWLAVLRTETERVGSVLVFDEIKTGFRLALGGAVERVGVVPDLAVYGKALANGYPLAAVAGTDAVMDGVNRTWISSTLATEFVALAAAAATLERLRELDGPGRIARLGRRFLDGLEELARRHPGTVVAMGVPEMAYLRFTSEAHGCRIAAECARRGVLFKRNAYNFVSVAHTDADVDRCLAVLDEAFRVHPT